MGNVNGRKALSDLTEGKLTERAYYEC